MFFPCSFSHVVSFRVHSFLNPPVFLFHPCFASLSSALFSAQSLLNPHLALLPASNPVPICWPWFRHQRENGGAIMHYITLESAVKQRKRRTGLAFTASSSDIRLTHYIEKSGPFCSSVALNLLQLFETTHHPAANQDYFLHTEAVAQCKWQKSLKYGVVTTLTKWLNGKNK